MTDPTPAADALREAVERLFGWMDSRPVEHALYADLRTIVDAALAAVPAVRERDAETWAQVADALGMTDAGGHGGPYHATAAECLARIEQMRHTIEDDPVTLPRESYELLLRGRERDDQAGERLTLQQRAEARGDVPPRITLADLVTRPATDGEPREDEASVLVESPEDAPSYSTGWAPARPPVTPAGDMPPHITRQWAALHRTERKAVRAWFAATPAGDAETLRANPWVGYGMWFDREQWGVITDALIQHRGNADQRKAANSESTSDVRSDMCDDLIQSITARARSVLAAAPAAERAEDGEPR